MVGQQCGVAGMGGKMIVDAHLMPTPPATKTTLLMLEASICGGGQTKLPPTLINSL